MITRVTLLFRAFYIWQCEQTCFLLAIDLSSRLPFRWSRHGLPAEGRKALLTGHLPGHWLLNNRLYSLPGRKLPTHPGPGLSLF